MLRAAAWTGGLFAVGGGICHLFPGPMVEPVVLLALGTALFLLSGRPRAPRPVQEQPPADPAALPAAPDSASAR